MAIANNSFDIDNIKAHFGALTKNNSASLKDFIQKIQLKNYTAPTISRQIETREKVITSLSSNMSEILQGFQIGWTPKGQATVDFQQITLSRFKIDGEIYPDDIKDSYLDFLEGVAELERANWPVVRWILETQVWPRYELDFEMKEIYKGVATPVTANTASIAGKTMDGIKTVINKGITAGRIAPISMGAIPTTAGKKDPVLFVKYMDEMMRSIDNEFWPFLGEINMSQENAELYAMGLDAMNVQYNRNDLASPYKLRTLPFNIKAITIDGKQFGGLPSHAGSDKIWVTTKGNDILLKKDSANIGNVKIESNKRVVSFFSDFYVGFGFLHQPHVFTNNLDLV